MFAVILIPDFSLQAALRQEPDSASLPVALVDHALPKPCIVQLTTAAEAMGVTEGLTASQAMARCPKLLIKTRSPAQEQAATDILLQTAYAFSPLIESTLRGVCTMELKGLGLNFDAESSVHRWAGQIIQTFASLNLQVRIGIAATPAMALLAARSALPHRETAEAAIRIVRDSSCFVSTLPITSLDPTPESSNILERWGIGTVGALLALNKNELVERLGAEFLGLLKQVSPTAARPLKLVIPRQIFEEQIEFEHEIETFEPLMFILRRFIEQLARRLDVIHLVVAEIHLRLKLSSGAAYEHSFKIPAATGNVETLFRMLQTHLETVRTDSPIASLRIEAMPCKPETHQFGLFETTLKDPNQFAETLARLTALCGTDRVGTPVLESTHRPDVFRMKAPEFNGNSARQQRREGAMPIDSNPPGLKLRRFRPSIPALIEWRGQCPTLIRSSAFNGAITDLRGPYFSSGDWWDRNPWQREEWDAQAADGALYRIVRTEEGCFVEGVYD